MARRYHGGVQTLDHLGGLAGTSVMVGVDDTDGIGIAAHPGASASAAFTTIVRRVVSRARCHCQTSSSSSDICDLNPGSKLRVVIENEYAKALE